MTSRVAVVGAGIAGASCAATLRAAGLDVEVLERGRTAGGRMASPTVGERRVDLGAAYFTVADPEFTEQAGAWRAQGLARPWTDTFDVLAGDGGRSTTTGPMRWAATDGLRSLVRDLDPQPRVGNEITDLADLDHDAVVLAMPDPQAARLAPGAVDWVGYEPVITVVASWADRSWDLAGAAFVNDDPDVTLVVDDGARRGDGAAVLVAHTTSALAARNLADPDAVTGPVLAALGRLLGITGAPARTRTHRWTFAKPAATHGDEPYAIVQHGAVVAHRDRPLGVCGDSWCPSGSPRVEAAWLSGRRLARELAERLGSR